MADRLAMQRVPTDDPEKANAKVQTDLHPICFKGTGLLMGCISTLALCAIAGGVVLLSIQHTEVADILTKLADVGKTAVESNGALYEDVNHMLATLGGDTHCGENQACWSFDRLPKGCVADLNKKHGKCTASGQTCQSETNVACDTSTSPWQRCMCMPTATTTELRRLRRENDEHQADNFVYLQTEAVATPGLVDAIDKGSHPIQGLMDVDVARRGAETQRLLRSLAMSVGRVGDATQRENDEHKYMMNLVA